MRSTSPRAWITVLTIATAFVTGIGVDRCMGREAQAQSLSTTTLYVPARGLVFRAPDGTALARLSRDAHGGTFELFDDRHEVSTRVQRAAPLSPVLAPNPFEIDADPWTSLPAAANDEFKNEF
jgi:hypothetical protein